MNIALKVKAKNGVLQKFIDEMGWNQAEFARRLGCSICFVGEWFNMKNYPKSAELQERVSQLIGKSFIEIFPQALQDPNFIPPEEKTFYRNIDVKLLPTSKAQDLLPYHEDFDQFDTSNSIKKALATLTPREEKVIRMRFGLEGEEGEHTYEEVGGVCDISKTRIQQIERKALKKLKHPARAKMLKGEEDDEQ